MKILFISFQIFYLFTCNEKNNSTGFEEYMSLSPFLYLLDIRDTLKVPYYAACMHNCAPSWEKEDTITMFVNTVPAG